MHLRLLFLILFLTCYYYYYYSLWVFFNWWYFTWIWVIASPLRSPGLFSVFWLILVILVRIVLTRPPNPNSSRPPTKPLRFAYRYNPLFGKFSFFLFFYFLLIIPRSGLLGKIRWSVSRKIQKALRITFSRTDSGLWMCHMLVWSNLNFLHNIQWITLSHPVMSCFVHFLRLFIVFADYVINHFVSITTKSTLAMLLHLIYFYFSIDGSCGVILCGYLRRDENRYVIQNQSE